jgi:hypothetical protein
MNFVDFILLLGVVLAGIAYFTRGRTRLKVVQNPKPHHLADAEYYSVVLDGSLHWFTEEQLSVARSRAALKDCSGRL